jgi:hypothetical protein
MQAMSFTDRLVLWLHIAFVVFAIGPVALAISSTPRYLRRRELPVLRYLARITVVFSFASLGVLVMGLIAAQQHKDFSKPWLTASMTLYVVALVLLALVVRDQRKAIRALESAGTAAAVPAQPAAGAGAGGVLTEDSAAGDAAVPGQPRRAPVAAVASVERGRIAMMGGVVNLIWLVILVLMVGNS